MRIGPEKLALYAVWLPFAIVLIPAEAAKKRIRLLAALILLSILLACSGAKSTNSNSSAPQTPAAPLAGTATPSGTYTIMIHANAGAMDSSTAVQLTVQ